MKLAKLVVRSGWHERSQCPVQVKLALASDVVLDRLVLWDLTSDEPVPVQAWPADDGQTNLAWIVSEIIEEDARVYELRYGPDVVPVEAEGVQVVDTGEGLQGKNHATVRTQLDGSLHTRTDAFSGGKPEIHFGVKLFDGWFLNQQTL